MLSATTERPLNWLKPTPSASLIREGGIIFLILSKTKSREIKIKDENINDLINILLKGLNIIR